MSLPHHQPPLRAVAPPAIGNQTSPYQPCDSCGAPLDDRQRYCVACGVRRKHANDPAARFLATATRRRRGSTSAATATAPPRHRRGSTSAATAALIAVIPLALGAGVLIGRSAAGGDGKLIAALRAEKAPVIEYSGGAPAAAGAQPAALATTLTSAPVSTFKLAHGYAVELGTLPAGTTRSAAARAQRADQAKGAASVGLIAQSDFRVTPSPPSGDFVIYAGSYASQSAAARALAGLKRRFPSAKVITVRAVASSAGAGGTVLARTQYGTARQVTNYKPSSQALSQGSQIASKDSHVTGSAASGSGLPDVVAVP